LALTGSGDLDGCVAMRLVVGTGWRSTSGGKSALAAAAIGVGFAYEADTSGVGWIALRLRRAGEALR
jgi:hypothetical protein